jgi:oligopeptide transport system ATP-binding protein
MEKLLEVRNLKVSYHTYAGEVKAVRGADFHLSKGETLAIVGESGCGKTATAKAIMRLVGKPNGEIKEQSEIIFEGQDVLRMGKEQVRKLRGGEIGMIFQDSMTSLNPTMKVGDQIAESLVIHRGLKRKEAFRRACEALEQVHIADSELMAHRYPHEFSGGMRQRVMIAMAAASSPKIIIADEPTTALDPTIQAEVIGLLKELQKNSGTSMILITHDLRVAESAADRVHIMYAGRIVEKAQKDELFANPVHPYTKALLQSVPKSDEDRKSRLFSMIGAPPDLSGDFEGCAFSNRCGSCMPVCLSEKPQLFSAGGSREVACWLVKGQEAENND